MNYSLKYDPNTGAICGSHMFTTEPASYPSDEIVCTEAQAQNPSLWVVVDGVLVNSLRGFQAAQAAIIKQSFIAVASAPITDSNDIIWEGGESSGNSIFLGCQLAQQAGATTITLYDAAKTPHSMTIAEGMVVAALIGTAYQTALGKKNTLYANINAAKTVKAVQAVVW